MYEKLTVTIRGLCPLMQHNIRLADPLDAVVKELKKLTKLKQKTDETHEEIMRLEWLGGLYIGDDGGPCVPGEHIEAMIREAAKKFKRGKDVQSSLFSYGNWPVLYDGPRDPDKLWNNPKFRDTRAVRVQSARTMRTRPIFHDWACRFELSYLPAQIDKADLQQWLATGGQLVGLMEHRPRYGRFEVVE